MRYVEIWEVEVKIEKDSKTELEKRVKHREKQKGPRERRVCY